MKDRFTRGFLSGVIAGIPALLFSLLAFYLKWTTLRWVHFASVLIYGRKFSTLGENIFCTLIVFTWLGFLGIVLAYLIPKLSSVNYLLKSWIYSAGIWFFSYAITILYKIPELQIIPHKTAVANLIEASIWGITVGYCLKWFDERIKKVGI